jgi:hypothetical protein
MKEILSKLSMIQEVPTFGLTQHNVKILVVLTTNNTMEITVKLIEKLD